MTLYRGLSRLMGGLTQLLKMGSVSCRNGHALVSLYGMSFNLSITLPPSDYLNRASSVATIVLAEEKLRTWVRS